MGHNSYATWDESIEIGRVIFPAGTALLWPFRGSANLNSRLNSPKLVKTICIFSYKHIQYLGTIVLYRITHTDGKTQRWV